MTRAEFLRGIDCLEYEDAYDAFPLTDEVRNAFFLDFPFFAKLGESSDDPGLFYLSSYLQLAYECHEKYSERGISDDIYFATFSDISVWASWYQRHTGKVGLDRINWLRHHVNLEIFRLGELQSEPAIKPLDDIWKSIDTSLPLFFIHIPEGVDLSKAEDSFQQILSFFHCSKAEFLIHSWLLSPEVACMLDEKSRIRNFASLFTLLGTEDDRQAEERIFGFISDNPFSYPESSSLAVKAKKYLERGGRILSGYGYREVSLK